MLHLIFESMMVAFIFQTIILELLTDRCSGLPLPYFCSLPKDRGHGNCTGGKSGMMMYFNKQKYECEWFNYDGCGGNRNRFSERFQCEEACLKVVPGDPPGGACVAPPPSCTGKLKIEGEDWKYDPAKRTCFKRPRHCYSETDMPTENECMGRCFKKRRSDACKYETTRGPCQPTTRLTYIYDRDANECKYLEIGECIDAEDEELWRDKEKCEKDCKNYFVSFCGLDPDPGRRCDRSTQVELRYHFDKGTERCGHFLYGMCGGNDNNFKSKSECERECRTYSRKGQDPCFLPKQEGNCTIPSYRYWYDRSVDQCKPFAYTGCGGNVNNFKTEADCKNKCFGDVCNTPVQEVHGPYCRHIQTMQERWTFKDNKCQTFWFTGCDGGRNNFETKEACEAFCIAPSQ